MDLFGCLRRFKQLFFIALLSVLSINVCAQQGVIQGTVTDGNGEAIIGANVVSEDGKVGVITDLDGHFQLKVPVGTKIKISFIGYETKVLKAAGNMKIVLAEDSQMLGEVQVVAYGVQKKVTVTGAIAGVKGEELTKVPTGSISNMLAGPISGISSVQYSGEPGSSAAQIFIRGKATFNDANPLVQVDGVERDLNEIDPNDIEDITVLKDASATAVFGVRGANGVILVTTKRGSEGKAKISFSSTESIVMPTSLPELANSYQYALFHNQRKIGDGATPLFSDDVIEKFRDHSDPLRFPDMDWIDYMMKDMTFQTRNNINISGGTKNVRYFLSAGAYTEGGLFKQFEQEYDNSYQYRRFNFRGNVDIDVTKSTTLSFSVSGSTDNSNKAKVGGITNLVRYMYYAPPFSSAGIVDGKFVRSQTTYKRWDGTTEEGVPFGGSVPFTQYYGKGYIATSNNKMTADVALKQKLDFITKGLSFHLKGSYNSSFYERKTAEADIATYYPVIQENGTFLYQKDGENKQLNIGSETATGVGRNWYMEGGLNYNRDFDNHHVGALLLYNQSKKYYPSTYGDIPEGYVGLVGRVTYDYKNRYMLDFNVGYNGSENFAPDKRFGWFPAGSVGYIISEENFFKPLKKVVSFFKMRASWGLVGNDKTGAARFYYLADPYGVNNGSLFIRNGYAYDFGTGSGTTLKGAYESSKNNQDVTWEKAFKQNYGVDINFFDDRLKASVDYYMEHRRDILLSDATAPAIIGFNIPKANLGSVDSWGWELSLKWNDRLNSNFRYWLGFNLSYNQNKIIEKKEKPQSYEYMMEKGHRIGSRNVYKFWKYYYEGIEADYEKTFGSPFPHQLVDDSKLKPGDCVYVDLNKDGVIGNGDTSRELGVYTDDPEYTVGANLGFSWKNLDVSMQFTGAWNVSRELTSSFRSPFHTPNSENEGGLLLYMYENTWTPENPSQSAAYPRATEANSANNYAGSDLFIVNSSYLRLKSAQISYNFNFPFMKKLKLNQFALSLSGYNLFTLTGFKFGDPESRTSDSVEYPLTRTFALGLKLGF
nr:TonB-dependent receptor [Bacteroides intestinalis]